MATTDYGRDLSCTDKISSVRYASGARLVAEAAYRRLITPRGMLRGGDEEADYGLDLVDLVGSVRATADAASLPGRIRNELEKDDRIVTGTVDVDVTVTEDGAKGRLFNVRIEAQTGAGPFTLTLDVSAVSVALVGLEAEG